MSASNESNHFLIGFSGGRDSHVLLHSLCELRRENPLIVLRAVHVNHGLHPRASEWEQFCQVICDKYSVPLTIHRLHLRPEKGDSIENCAREGRYRIFSEMLQINEILLTAHHLEDQAETILIQLLRGSGPKGLASMPELKPFHHGWHGRPLLSMSRSYIEEYAREHELTWVEDDSNDNIQFTRNFIRHRVFQALNEVNPSFASCLARSAQHCADTQNLLDSYVENDLRQCLGDDNALVISGIIFYSPLRQQAIFRHWLLSQGYPLPSTKKLQTMVHQMLNAKQDRKPCVEWGDWQVVRQKGRLYVQKRKVYTVLQE